MSAPRVQRRYELREPNILVVDFHDPACPCHDCETMRAEAAAREAIRTFCAAGWLSLLGVAIGSAIAFAIDPHGAWLALTTVFGGGR